MTLPQPPLKHRILPRVSVRAVVLLAVVLYAVYLDVIAIKAPALALVFCPLLLVLAVLVALFKGGGLRVVVQRIFLGPPLALLVVPMLSLAFAQAHDRLIMLQVRNWGNELRAEKVRAGHYPGGQVRKLHGYKAIFFDRGAGAGADAVIVFDKFDDTRQSYLVEEDRFLEEVAL